MVNSRAQQVRPTQQRGGVRHRCHAQAAELAQHQAVADEGLGLRVAPGVQVLHHQRARPALTQIGPNLLEQLIQAVWQETNALRTWSETFARLRLEPHANVAQDPDLAGTLS
jgi:hypothetical protein